MNKRYEYGGFIYCDDDLSHEIKNYGVDSKINFNINFASDIRVGTAKVADGAVTFTEGTAEA